MLLGTSIEKFQHPLFLPQVRMNPGHPTPTMTLMQLDARHRSFYAEDDGKIHADEENPAGDKSLVVK